MFIDWGQGKLDEASRGHAEVCSSRAWQPTVISNGVGRMCKTDAINMDKIYHHDGDGISFINTGTTNDEGSSDQRWAIKEEERKCIRKGFCLSSFSSKALERDARGPPDGLHGLCMSNSCSAEAFVEPLASKAFNNIPSELSSWDSFSTKALSADTEPMSCGDFEDMDASTSAPFEFKCGVGELVHAE